MMRDVAALLVLFACGFLQARAIADLAGRLEAAVMARLVDSYQHRLDKRNGERRKHVVFDVNGADVEAVIPERCTIMEFLDARYVQVNECIPRGDGLAVIFVREGEADD